MIRENLVRKLRNFSEVQFICMDQEGNIVPSDTPDEPEGTVQVPMSKTVVEKWLEAFKELADYLEGVPPAPGGGS